MKRTGPDSVDSWIATFLCSFIGMVLYGMVRLSGMLFVASMEEYNVDREKASFPYVLCDVTYALIGPVTGYLACKFGTRPVIMFGSLLAAVGVGTNFLAEDIGTVTILWGVVFGIGFGFCCPILPIVITHHFVKKRATAIGFMYVGSYVGMSILPTILEFLVKEYGLKGTFLWLGAMVLHCVPASMLLRNPKVQKFSELTGNVNLMTYPLYAAEKYIIRKYSVDYSCSGTLSHTGSIERHRTGENLINTDPGNLTVKDRNHENSLHGFKPDEFNYDSLKVTKKSPNLAPIPEVTLSPDLRKYSSSKCQSQISCQDPFFITSSDIRNSKLIQTSSTLTFRDFINKSNNLSNDLNVGPPEARKSETKPSEAFKVFLEPIFLLVLLANAVYICSFIALMTIVVDFAEDIGLPFSDGKYLILGFSIASNVGLLSFGWVTDYGYMSLTNFSGLVFFLRSVTLAAIPYSKGFWMFLSILMTQGVAEASIANVLPLIIADNYNDDVHAVAISCSFLLSGPLHLAIPSLISFFRDGLGSYNYLFYSMSAASLLSSVLLFLAPLLGKCRCVKDDTILRNKDIPTSLPTVIL